MHELFADLPVSRSGSGRWTPGIRVSLAAHLVIILATFLGIAVRPEALPPPARTLRGILLYDPPAAAAPLPLPLGRGALERSRSAPPPTVPSAATLLAPIEPAPDEPAAPAPELAPGGSPTGSASGSSEGMEGGLDGGAAGGIPGGDPGGVPGGSLGGTGWGAAGDYDRAPRPIRVTRPLYPREAFINKIQGTVQLEILIDAQGSVVDARVVGSIPLLDAAALATVREWQFVPAMRDGRPVAARALAPITFRIH